MTQGQVDSGYAWYRLVVGLVLSTIGGVGMWSVVVALPSVQAEFGVARADASLPYTLTMIGFGVGSIVMGKLSDRYGIIVPWSSARSRSRRATRARLGREPVAIRDGPRPAHRRRHAATFAPLLAHMSLWFGRRRGDRRSASSQAATISPAPYGPWSSSTSSPPTAGARRILGIAIFVLATMLPLALLLRRPPPHVDAATAAGHAA